MSKCFPFCSSLSDGKFSALAPTPPARPHAFVDIRSVHTHYTCNSKRIGTLFLKLRSWYSQAPSPPRFELFVRIPSTAASGGMMSRQTLTLAIIDQKGPTGHGAPAIRSKIPPAAQKIIKNSPTPIATDQGTQARHEHGHPALTLNRSIGPASAQNFERTLTNRSAAVRLTLPALCSVILRQSPR